MIKLTEEPTGGKDEGDIFCDVLRPMLKRIEGDNADRVVESSRHQIDNDSFEVGPLDFRLAVETVPSPPKRSITR